MPQYKSKLNDIPSQPLPFLSALWQWSHLGGKPCRSLTPLLILILLLSSCHTNRPLCLSMLSFEFRISSPLIWNHQLSCVSFLIDHICIALLIFSLLFISTFFQLVAPCVLSLKPVLFHKLEEIPVLLRSAFFCNQLRVLLQENLRLAHLLGCKFHHSLEYTQAA